MDERASRQGNDAFIIARVGENESVGDYRKLDVWRKAHALAINVHRDVGNIKGTRYASLRSQLVRAAMSIPANIVEGRSQISEKEFGRFLRYAAGSASELEYHLTLARDIGVMPNKDFTPLHTQTVEVRKMLHGLVDPCHAR
jgi:four helix bundle protein